MPRDEGPEDIVEVDRPTETNRTPKGTADNLPKAVRGAKRWAVAQAAALPSSLVGAFTRALSKVSGWDTVGP